MKDQDGRALPTQEECERRWVGHFKEVLNQSVQTPAFDRSLLNPTPDLPVNLDTITVVETKNVIWVIKNGKAAGLDEIPPELLKSGEQCLADALTDLLNACWATSAVPEEWKRGMTIMLPKKAISPSDNWQGITLLLVPGKVFSIVLLNRLRVVVACLRDQQAGFRSD